MITFFLFLVVVVVIILIFVVVFNFKTREETKIAMSTTRAPVIQNQTYLKDWKEKLPKTQPEKPFPSIFISIASYRDSLCPSTLMDMYANADHPDRIFTAVIQQNIETDQECLIRANCIPMSNVLVRRLHAKEAKGPTYARELATQLYEGQDFFLQIDSHMRFLPHWDTEYVKMYKLYSEKLSTDKVVISQYPMEFDVKTNTLPDKWKTHTAVTYTVNWNEGIPIGGAASIGIFNPNEKMYEQPIAAAGVLFGPGKMLKDVPFDPSLNYLFHGEEVLYSIRLWAAGYKIMAPYRNYFFHYYYREKDPKFWEKPDFSKENKAITKIVKRALLIDKSDGVKPKYSPTVQQVQAYYKYWEIDIEKQTAKKQPL